MLKIGIVAYICNPRSGARAPIELARALARENEVSFYATTAYKNQETIKMLKSEGIKVVLFRKSNVPLFGSFFDFLSLYKLLKDSANEVLSAHTTLPLLLACRATRIPLVGTYYGTQFNVLNERFIRGNPLTSLLNKLLNAIISIKSHLLTRLPDEVLAISKYCAQEAKKLYGRKFRYIYLGSAPAHFVPAHTSPRAHQPISVLSVSRITPYKGFEKIIKVISQMNDQVNLTIAGSSPQKRYLDYLKKIKNSRTKIVLKPSDATLARLYKNCDIYVTADKYLFFGMPIMEAASFGKPAVSMNYAAAPELVEHGKTGFVAQNEQEFKKYIERLVNNASLRDKMGRKAQERSLKQFTWDKTAKGYVRVFKNLLKHG